MKKQIIKEIVFERDYEGIVNGVRFADIPIYVQPNDIIDIEKEEAYYSDNNSYDAQSRLIIYRERLENDEEFEKRKKKSTSTSNELKKRRFETYQKLKQEFENEKN